MAALVDVSWFNELSGYEQIARYVSRAGQRAERWIAIDDDGEGWHPDLRRYLVETNGMIGLSSATAQAQLRLRLQEMAKRN
ncbi:HAD domain-containing protein [Cupriavidus sp. CP313]